MGLGQTPFPFTRQGQALQALRVQLLLLVFQSLKRCLWLPTKGWKIQGQGWGGEAGQRDSLTLPSRAVFRRRPHLLPWQAQGNSAQPGQTPLGAMEAAASFGGIEQEQD